MLGAYLAYQVVQWAATTPGRFWWATIGAALGIAALGGVVERLLLRHLYAKEELYQLLFTYALVLILGNVAKKLWGTGQLSVSRPPGLTGAVELFGTRLPYYNLFILLLGPAIALAFWIVLHRTRTGRFIRAAALARGVLGALGVRCGDRAPCPRAVGPARHGRRVLRPRARLALLHVRRDRRGHHGPLRGQPQSLDRLHRPRLLRSRRLLRHRRLHHRHPHEEA